MRSIRRAVRLFAGLGGAVLVLVAVSVDGTYGVRLMVAVLGLGMVVAASGGAIYMLVPNDREYHALRREGDRFLALLRQLNTAAIELRRRDSTGARLAVGEIRTRLHASVDAMVRVAGLPAAEPASGEELDVPDPADGAGLGGRAEREAAAASED